MSDQLADLDKLEPATCAKCDQPLDPREPVTVCVYDAGQALAFHPDHAPTDWPFTLRATWVDQ